MPEYKTEDVSEWAVVRTEPVGADEKYWLARPLSGERWLFKANNVHTTADRHWSQREDLAEKVAGELAGVLGVPAAKIELARRGDQFGCISRDLLPGDDWELQTGAVLLDGLLDDYVPGWILENKLRIGHSLSNIRSALDGYAAPLDSGVPDDFDGFDVFAGYVTFDAVVANMDRHDQNWAVLRSLKSARTQTICGSFDHARALGSTVLEGKMALILGNGEIAKWVAKGTARRFEHTQGALRTLVEVAAEALSMVRPKVRRYWLDAVSSLTPGNVAQITDQLPAEVSEVPRNFMHEVVVANRRRVLDGC